MAILVGIKKTTTLLTRLHGEYDEGTGKNPRGVVPWRATLRQCGQRYVKRQSYVVIALRCDGHFEILAEQTQRLIKLPQLFDIPTSRVFGNTSITSFSSNISTVSTERNP